MTVENSVSKTPKLVMGAKTYDFNFDVLLEDPTAEEARRAIKCSISNGVDETELIYGTDYTVTLNSDKKGGVVTVTDAKDDDWHIVIYRQYNMTQGMDLNDYNEFPAETIERAFDKQTMLIQELKEIAERSVKVTPANNQTPEELLDEVYSKLDSATDVATNAIAAATLATTAAESATKAVAEATEYVATQKVEIDKIVTDAQNSVDTAITQATEDVKTAATEAAEAIIQDAGQTATNIAVDYVNTSVKPELQAIADSVERYDSTAKASAQNAKASELNAKTSEQNAKDSEVTAKSYAESVVSKVYPIEGALGDIGIAPLGIDETKNLRRYLNGQVISQTQFVAFTNLIKQRILTNPSIATTEENWQSEVSLSINGTCGKFVVDDNLGTIRLPKYPEYCNKEYVEVASRGKGTAIGLDGRNGFTGYWVNRGPEGSAGHYTVAVTNSNVLGTGTTGWAEIGALGIASDPTKSGIVTDFTHATSETLPCKWFIQVATGSEEEVNITNEIQLNNPFSLLDYKWSEYAIDNASWLISNGSFHSGATYPAVYDLLLKIYNGTETKEGVSVKLSTEEYTDTDFVLNTADTTFRLPIKVKLASGMRVAGNGLTLGLTGASNSSGTLQNYGLLRGSSTATALYAGVDSYGTQVGSIGNEVGSLPYVNARMGITLDPTKSGIETSSQDLYLYFYVGETIQDANVIAASNALTEIANLKGYDYVVESYGPDEDGDWYRVYKSGWIEQGGFVEGIDDKTINFLKSFSNTNYNVVLEYDTIGYQLACRNKTTTSFEARATFTPSGSGRGNNSGQWLACGQGA